MDKASIINIAKEFFIAFKENTLSPQKILEILKKNKPQEFLSENEITYKTTEFLCFLFHLFPYYQIENSILEIKAYLIHLKIENNIINLLNGFLDEILPNIYERVKTEIHAHFYITIKNIYNEQVNIDHEEKRFAENLYHPRISF